MTDLNYENRFIDKIFTEFEQKLFRVFGFGYAELEVVLNREPEEDLEGNNVTDNFAEAFKNGGPAKLRWEMNNTIACLGIFTCANGLNVTLHMKSGRTILKVSILVFAERTWLF